MKTIVFNLSAKKLARITGMFYFIIIFCGLYSGMVVRASIVVPMDENATLRNLMANESLFRIGFISDMIMVVSDIMVAVLFYYLLKEVHKMLAGLAAIFRLIQSGILGANLINLFTPLILIQGHGDMDTPQINSLASEVMNRMEIFEYGYLISGVFFAFNCLIMGYLLYKSELFPRALGIMITIASFGYMFNCMANFLVPSLVEISQMVLLFTAIIAELALCLWLLIKGVRKTNQENLAFA